MKSKIEIDEINNICIINLANRMNEEETDALFNYLDNEPKLKTFYKFICVIPEDFLLLEYFRKKAINYIREENKKSLQLKIAVVTKLMNVKGYESVARFVTNMISKEKIFESIQKAKEWLSRNNKK
ncbi:MAG: hypothetical protein ACTSXP_00235 [Promethearchaeota archaeon]